MKVCAVTDCESPVWRRDWCNRHYQRWLKHGDPLLGRKKRETQPPVCTVDGCARATAARGYCNLHYHRWAIDGDPATLVNLPWPEGLWARIDKNGPVSEYAPHLGPCWLWTGALNNKGYGRAARGSAHKAVYEFLRGPVPAGLELDHLCRVTHCANPDHLEPVTHRENVVRGYLARRVLIPSQESQ